MVYGRNISAECWSRKSGIWKYADMKEVISRKVDMKKTPWLEMAPCTEVDIWSLEQVMEEAAEKLGLYQIRETPKC